jgi:hypothetical protein
MSKAPPPGSSGITSEDGEPDFFFFVFDLVSEDPRAPFIRRYRRVCDLVEERAQEWLPLVEHIHISNLAELEAFEAKSVELGFESISSAAPTASTSTAALRCASRAS